MTKKKNSEGCKLRWLCNSRTIHLTLRGSLGFLGLSVYFVYGGVRELLGRALAVSIFSLHERRYRASNPLPATAFGICCTSVKQTPNTFYYQ